MLPSCPFMWCISKSERVFLQNHLFALSFNMYFTYLLCGWEGAASETCVFADAKANGFIVPLKKYLLG
jgi:hypothetical protein